MLAGCRAISADCSDELPFSQPEPITPSQQSKGKASKGQVSIHSEIPLPSHSYFAVKSTLGAILMTASLSGLGDEEIIVIDAFTDQTQCVGEEFLCIP